MVLIFLTNEKRESEVGLRVLHRTTVEGKHIPHIKDTLFLIICVVNTINK
jgi:hypothetical protein